MLGANTTRRVGLLARGTDSCDGASRRLLRYASRAVEVAEVVHLE
jgi:hypothetical protein